MKNDYTMASCVDYGVYDESVNLHCKWQNALRVISFGSQTFVVVIVLCLIIWKISRRSNRYIIIFLLLIEISCSCEFLASFAQLNTSSINFYVHFYGGKDHRDLKRFEITYTMIGYLYYAAQALFLWAHWMLAFVYLYTAFTLWYRLTLDTLLVAQQMKFNTSHLMDRSYSADQTQSSSQSPKSLS